MNAVVLMSAVLLGQCSGGRCPAPSFDGGFLGGSSVVIDEGVILPSSTVVMRPASIVGSKRYGIRHEDLEFEVMGVRNGDGTIRWNPDLEFNRRAWNAAKAEVRHERRPKAVIEPKPEPAPQAEPKGEKPLKQETGQTLNFGLAPEKLGRHRDEYTAGSPEAQQFVQAAKAQAGDEGKLHVTVIGAVEDCAPVVNDLKTSPAFASLRDRLMIQDYRPDEWAVDPSLGFQTHGKPTILVQQARGDRDSRGGRVIYRAMDYSMGAEGLAEAIRKADPNYNPANDPGPATGRNGSCPLGFTRDHWPVILVVGIVVALVFRRPSHKEPRP